MPVSSGSRIGVQESGAGSWQNARTLVNQVAEAGAPGVWVDLGAEYPLVEVSYENLAVVGAPDFVLLYVWRLVGAKDDIAGVIRIPAAEVSTWRSERLQLDAQQVAITVAFEGGAAPNLSGTLQVRYIRSGETTLGQSSGGGTSEVAGVDPDDDPATANPVLVGGRYALDPSVNPLEDGDAGYMLLTAQRRVQAEVRGPTTDDAAVTANPVAVGGVHYADPSANPIDNGDVGHILLTAERRPWVEDRAYDSPTDANRVVSVWSDTDLFLPEGISGSASGNGTTSYYIVLGSYSRWSIQYIPVIAGGETLTLRTFQSNHDVDDPTTATFQDVTNTFFGVLGFTTTQWIELASPTRAKFMRIDVIVSGYTAGTPAWTIHFAKGGNS